MIPELLHLPVCNFDGPNQKSCPYWLRKGWLFQNQNALEQHLKIEVKNLLGWFGIHFTRFQDFSFVKLNIIVIDHLCLVLKITSRRIDSFVRRQINEQILNVLYDICTIIGAYERRAALWRKRLNGNSTLTLTLQQFIKKDYYTWPIFNWKKTKLYVYPLCNAYSYIWL